jgi:hypothetical protein
MISFRMFFHFKRSSNIFLFCTILFPFAHVLDIHLKNKLPFGLSLVIFILIKLSGQAHPWVVSLGMSHLDFLRLIKL